MANIKDILLVSGCTIYTREYIDDNHRLAKKIIAKKSCRTKNLKLSTGFYTGYMSFDSTEEAFEIYIVMDNNTTKINAMYCSNGGFHKEYIYPKRMLGIDFEFENKLSIGAIDIYRRCFREWVEHLYTIGAINKEQADYLLGPYTYRLNTKDAEVFNRLFKYVDIEKTESYDNSNTKLDF